MYPQLNMLEWGAAAPRSLKGDELMVKPTNDDISFISEKKHILLRIKEGTRAIMQDKRKLAILLAYVAVALAVFILRTTLFNTPFDGYSLLAAAYELLLSAAILLTSMLGLGLLIILLGTPACAHNIRIGLKQAGITNHAGEAPILLRKTKSKINKLTEMVFVSEGIPLTKWKDNKQAVETALNMYIADIAAGDRANIIVMQAVEVGTLPDKIIWKDSYLSPDSFVLTLGESFLGPVTVNLAKVPHILLGGSTGSGKSVLLKLLLMQCLLKNAVVCIADFKGGVDFPPVWHKKCHMCFTEDSLLYHLEILVDELNCRKKLFQGMGVPNIDSYNEIESNPIRRMIFACDEVAELLDKTGLNKDEKAIISKIEACLSTIARQGRAFGIHLILATQRPDATIIPGQIRNNLDIRICGRADNVLSQIILDSTAAADHIPKDIGGRFMLYDETVFQAYWFDENNL